MNDEKKINNGGEAFPRNHGYRDVPGMSLRDYFAAKAMAAMISNTKINRKMNFIKKSYEIADSMIKESNK